MRFTKRSRRCVDVAVADDESSRASAVGHERTRMSNYDDGMDGSGMRALSLSSSSFAGIPRADRGYLSINKNDINEDEDCFHNDGCLIIYNLLSIRYFPL